MSHGRPDSLATSRVPLPCGAVLGGGDYSRAVGTEVCRHNPGFVLQRDAGEWDYEPHASSAICRARQYPTAVRAELCRYHKVSVRKRCTQGLSASSVPNSRGLILGGGDHTLAIWTELCPQNSGIVHHRFSQRPTRGDIPKPS